MKVPFGKRKFISFREIPQLKRTLKMELTSSTACDIKTNIDTVLIEDKDVV